MLTYQDLLKVNQDDEKARMAFVRAAIFEHKSSEEYKIAVTADEYARKRNTTITEYQKLLYTLSGATIPDTYSANYKLSSGFFKFITTQEVQYLLGNGCTWQNEDTEEKLGVVVRTNDNKIARSDFDTKLQKVAKIAVVQGEGFGFFNLDHLEVFELKEYKPIYDEENGSMRAGVRFWQIDATKPMRATLYEEDGYTEYIFGERDTAGTANADGRVFAPKRPYVVKTKTSEVDGTYIYDGENYPVFPIVPLWGNPEHQSGLIGLREQIDAYDLIRSGFCNTVDEASIIYWIIQGAGGMDDFDLTQFLDRIRKTHAAAPQQGQTVEAHSIEPPFQSREALLDRLENDIYRDAMAFDPRSIVSGSTVQAQIRAAYEPLNEKTDEFEYCVLDFVDGILKVAGIEDIPTFTRSMMVNVQEEVQTVLQAASCLDEDYVTTKILTLLGDGDQAEEILKRRDAEGMDRFNNSEEDVEEEMETTNVTEEAVA